jgi:hypothetical protein
VYGGMNGTVLRCAGGFKPLEALYCTTPEVCDGAERALRDHIQLHHSVAAILLA